MKSGIYEIVNTANGRRYIGSAANFEGRFAAHRTGLRKGTHHSRYLQQAWNKYGAGSFEFRRLLICARRDLLVYEQIAIDGLAPAYNICRIAGSGLGIQWSDEAKARIKARPNDHFKGRKHSAETLRLMSEKQMGNTATRGKPRRPESIAKTAAAHTGMKRSVETRQRMSEAMTGKIRGPKSAEHRAKLSAALRGRSTLSSEALARMAATKRGQKHSEEHKAKIGIASRAAWARRRAA